MQAAVARQQGTAARPCSSDMPPPPPRPSTALQPRATADAAGSSSESDIDVDIDLDDSFSPETDHVTAAWIERQRRCPEPFLSAADYARRAGRRPNRAAAPVVAAAPVAADTAAAAIAPAHPGQASALTQTAAAAGQSMLAPARTLPSARQSLLAAAEGSASASQRLPAATQGIATATQGSSAAAAQLSPAAGQAPVLPRAGVKNSRHGVKPPLYPAKRVKSPDGGGRSTLQASAGHAAGTAASPTPSTINNVSYTAAEPGIGATAPTQGAPDKPDATVDATSPSTCAHTGATAEAAIASCTGMDEGLVPGAHPHAPIPVAPAATPAPSRPQCVNCQPNPVTCDLSCWPLILLDKTWTAMHCAALSGAALKVLKLAC